MKGSPALSNKTVKGDIKYVCLCAHVRQMGNQGKLLLPA